MFDFENLEVYKKSKVFTSTVRREIIKKNTLDSSTKNQLNRAAVSVMLNIAEGAGRFTNPDKRNFYVIARGSVFECVAILDLLIEEDIIDKERFIQLYKNAEELSKMLFSMIKRLSK